MPKKPLQRTEDYLATHTEPTKLPALDTDRKIANHLKITHELLVRRAYDKAEAEMAKLPPGKLIGLHQTEAGMMLLSIRSMYPAQLSQSDIDLLNDYLFPDRGQHYSDELLKRQ